MASLDTLLTRDVAKKLGVDIVGEIVTWETGRSKGFNVKHVREALSSSDLNPDYATEISPRSAFTRACAYLKENRVISRLGVDEDYATFQFTQENLTDDERKYDYVYEAHVKVHIGTGLTVCEESSELQSEVQKLVNECKDMRTPSDITNLVQRLFVENGDLFPINPHKGVAYFVPSKFSEFTDKVAKMLSCLNGELWRFPVPKGTPGGDAAVKHAIDTGVRTMIGELVEIVDGWNVKTRGDTMLKYGKKVELIQHKIKAYSALLKDRVESLEFALGAASEQLQKKKSELEQEHANAK